MTHIRQPSSFAPDFCIRWTFIIPESMLNQADK